MICERCLKSVDFDGAHTCTPTKYANRVEVERDAAWVKVEKLSKIILVAASYIEAADGDNRQANKFRDAMEDALSGVKHDR